MAQKKSQNTLPLIKIEMEGKIIVDANTYPPDMVHVIKVYPNNNKEIYIKAVVDAEVLSLHLQKETMRVRILPSDQYSFAGTKDMWADAFFKQYVIEPAPTPQSLLNLSGP